MHTLYSFCSSSSTVTSLTCIERTLLGALVSHSYYYLLASGERTQLRLSLILCRSFERWKLCSHDFVLITLCFQSNRKLQVHQFPASLRHLSTSYSSRRHFRSRRRLRLAEELRSTAWWRQQTLVACLDLSSNNPAWAHTWKSMTSHESWLQTSVDKWLWLVTHTSGGHTSGLCIRFPAWTYARISQFGMSG